MYDNKEHSPKKIVPATLHGAHRSYNRLSTVSRGTPQQPGLVLGLEPGGRCEGRAMLVDDRSEASIDTREGAGIAYEKTITPKDRLWVESDSEPIDGCIVYLPTKGDGRYVGDLPIKERIAIVLHSGKGKRGTSAEYIADINAFCMREGIDDPAVREMQPLIEQSRESSYS